MVELSPLGTVGLEVWAGEDANNFIPSKSGIMIWAYTAKRAVIGHSK